MKAPIRAREFRAQGAAGYQPGTASSPAWIRRTCRSSRRSGWRVRAMAKPTRPVIRDAWNRTRSRLPLVRRPAGVRRHERGLDLRLVHRPALSHPGARNDAVPLPRLPRQSGRDLALSYLLKLVNAGSGARLIGRPDFLQRVKRSTLSISSRLIDTLSTLMPSGIWLAYAPSRMRRRLSRADLDRLGERARRPKMPARSPGDTLTPSQRRKASVFSPARRGESRASAPCPRRGSRASSRRAAAASAARGRPSAR